MLAPRGRRVGEVRVGDVAAEGLDTVEHLAAAAVDDPGGESLAGEFGGDGSTGRATAEHDVQLVTHR